jgi:hypothetical protein
MLALVVAWTMTLGLLGSFGDFALGKQGNADLRTRLSRLNEDAQGDWRGLYQVPARLFGQFVLHGLRTRPISSAAILISINVIYAFIMIWLTDGTTPLAFFQAAAGAPRMILLLFANLAPDALGWGASAFIIARIGSASSVRAIALVVGALLLWAFNWWAQSFFISFVFNGGLSGTLPEDTLHMSTGLMRFALTGHAGHNGVGGYLFVTRGLILGLGMLSGIPLAIYLLGTLLGVILFIGRPILQRPWSVVLARLSESDKPVLTMCGLLAGAIGVVVAWSKAVHQGP